MKNVRIYVFVKFTLIMFIVDEYIIAHLNYQQLWDTCFVEIIFYIHLIRG